MKNCSKMVVRYYIGSEHTEERFKYLEDFLKRTGIRRVILFSAPFAGFSSFVGEDFYKEHVRALEPIVERLRAMGVETGINMLYTIGHAYYADEKESGFRRAITIDGEPARGCACIRDRKLKGYIENIYKYFAALSPSVIFADDDIRCSSLGQMTCFCDTHVKLISERVGRRLTREDIKKAVLCPDCEPNDIKKACFEQMAADTEYAIGLANDAVHEISPNTEFGIMTISYPDMTLDRDIKGFFERNYDKKVTRIRPGMGFYREGAIKDITITFSSPAIQRGFIDDPRVELQPEVENDIYGYFYKSNAVTDMQIVWCLTNGFGSMQLNLFDFINPEVANYDGVSAIFEKNMPFYNKLAELIPEGTRSSGINIYAHPQALKYRRAIDGSLMFTPWWYMYLQVDGLPLGYNIDTAKWILLSGDDVAGADDNEIDALLKKGAVIDFFAAEILVKRGFGTRIGIKKIKKLKQKFAGELFADNAVNGEYAGQFNSDYFCSSLIGNDTVGDIEYEDGAVQISYIIDHHGDVVCCGSTLYENMVGERFCIIPTYPLNEYSQFSNINNRRKRQLINVFEWVSRTQLPVCALNEKVCVNINELDGKNIITLFNLTYDTIKNPKIKYSVKGNLKYLDRAGRLKELPYCEDGINIEIEKKIIPAGVLVVVDVV